MVEQGGVEPTDLLNSIVRADELYRTSVEQIMSQINLNNNDVEKLPIPILFNANIFLHSPIEIYTYILLSKKHFVTMRWKR